MKAVLHLVVAASILATQIFVAQGTKELLFDDGKYNLTIEQIPDGIRFHLNVETLGWVGLGISPNPNMANADIFIGGITDADSTPFHGDYHAPSNTRPTRDDQDDWTLLVEGSSQSATHTILTVSRLLVTGDISGQDQDIPADARIHLLWAYGPTDEVNYHQGKRGYTFINLVDENDLPTTTGASEEWTTVTLPEDGEDPTTTTEAGGGGSKALGYFSVLFIAAVIKVVLEL